MATTEDIYQRFQIKANDNFETSKIAVDRGRFVVLFTEAEDKLIQNILDGKKDDELRYLQKILVKDYKIKLGVSTETTDNFPLPKNYFDFSSAYTKATKGKCSNKRINLFEIKDDNIGELFSDEFNKPSFLARESLFTFADNNLIVFKNDFKNNELFLSYYRYPQKIRLIDENNPESNFDENYQCEFDDKFVNRIISNAVAELKINNSDPTYVVNKQQSQNKL